MSSLHGLRLGGWAKAYYPQYENDLLPQNKWGRIVEWVIRDDRIVVTLAYKTDYYKLYNHYLDYIIAVICRCGKKKLWNQQERIWFCPFCN